MTTRFISAAELMCRVLGMPDYKFVIIGHPISSASEEHVRRIRPRHRRSGLALIAARFRNWHRTTLARDVFFLVAIGGEADLRGPD